MDAPTILIIILVGLVFLGFIYFNLIFPRIADKQEAQKKEAENKETENKDAKAEADTGKNATPESEEAADSKPDAKVMNMHAKSKKQKKGKR